MLDSESGSADLAEIRFRIVKIMLEEFPELKRRVKEYLEGGDVPNALSST